MLGLLLINSTLCILASQLQAFLHLLLLTLFQSADSSLIMLRSLGRYSVKSHAREMSSFDLCFALLGHEIGFGSIRSRAPVCTW